MTRIRDQISRTLLVQGVLRWLDMMRLYFSIRATATMSVLILFTVLGASVQAANYHVGPSSSGNGSGSDWNNRMSWSSMGSGTRGNVYYLMEGSYGGKSFSAGTSGSSTITIKKATAAEHGSNTGWSDSMGDGQCTFGQISFTRAYYIFDGVTGGGPGSWKSGYGFKVNANSGPGITIPWDAPGNNVTIRHVEVEGHGPDGAGSPPNDGIHIGNQGNNVTVSYAWIHDMGRTLFFISGDNVTLEYIYGGQFESVGEQHAESLSCWEGSPQSGPGCNNLTVRWSVFDYFRATGGIIVEGRGTQVYGCVFWGPPGEASSFTGQAVIGTWSSRKWQDGKVYNNTFYNLGGCAAHGLWTSEDSGTFQNNLYIDVGVGGYPGGTVSHNHYDSSGSYGSSVTTGSVNLESTDWTRANFFKPSANTASGTALSAPYNVDWHGNTRSTWTRGAVEFSGGDPVLTANAGSDFTITLPSTGLLTGSYVNPLGGIVNLSWSKVSGPGTVGFSDPASANTTATFSSAGTYVLRLTASALTVSASDDITVTVNPAPDSENPTVNLTAPNSSAVVSNSVTLSASAADTGGSGLASVTFLVDGASVGTDSSAPYSVSWNSQAVPNGSHTIRARAVDGAGNQTTSAAVTVTTLNPEPDTTPPTVALTAPSAGASVSDSITFSATASDNSGGSGVASVSFLVDGAVVGSDNNAPYSFTWNSKTVPNGSHSIQARATDGSGNQATSGSVSITVENLAPVLHLAFEEGQGTVAADSSGLGNNGSYMNGVSWASGPVSQAISFDGADDYIQVPTSASLESPTTALTVSAWVNPEANGQWQAVARKILEEGVHAYPYAAFDMLIEETGGQVLPRMAVSRPDGNRGLVYGATALTYGEWVHLTGVFDGTSVKIYVNGSLDGTAAFSGSLVQTGQSLLIGRNGIGGDVFKGMLDDFRVYNRVLSDTEIGELAGQARRPQPASNLIVLQ